MFEHQKTAEHKLDIQIADNLKLKGLYTKAVYELIENNNKIGILNERLKQSQADTRSLKKQVKVLQQAIVEDSDSDSEEDPEDTTEDPTPLFQPSPTNKEDILSKYQKIKNYLTQQRISISTLCRRHKIPIYQKRLIFERFISLKLRRNYVAHPDVSSPIQSDNELLDFLIK